MKRLLKRRYDKIARLLWIMGLVQSKLIEAVLILIAESFPRLHRIQRAVGFLPNFQTNHPKKQINLSLKYKRRMKMHD